MASVFPDSIDNRLWFSDVKVSQKSTMDSYQNLISNENYTEASELLNNSEVSFLGKEVLDTFEDEIIKIEEYIDGNLTANTNWYFTDHVPNHIKVGEPWVSDKDDFTVIVASTQAGISEQQLGVETGLVE